MLDLQKLKEQNRLTLTDDGKIIVKPIDKYNFLTFPFEDLTGCLFVTVDEYVGLRLQCYMFNDELDGIVEYIAPIEDEGQGDSEDDN